MSQFLFTVPMIPQDISGDPSWKFHSGNYNAQTIDDLHNVGTNTLQTNNSTTSPVC